MRDHYRKIILPKIDSFDLTDKQKNLLKSTADGETSMETDGMTFIEVIVMQSFEVSAYVQRLIAYETTL